jgi:hypothetical protein
MLRIGMLLIGGAIITAGAGLVILSVAANGAASSLGVLANCAPTPPEDEKKKDQSQPKKSETSS